MPAASHHGTWCLPCHLMPATSQQPFLGLKPSNCLTSWPSGRSFLDLSLRATLANSPFKGSLFGEDLSPSPTLQRLPSTGEKHSMDLPAWPTSSARTKKWSSSRNNFSSSTIDSHQFFDLHNCADTQSSNFCDGYSLTAGSMDILYCCLCDWDIAYMTCGRVHGLVTRSSARCLWIVAVLSILRRDCDRHHINAGGTDSESIIVERAGKRYRMGRRTVPAVSLLRRYCSSTSLYTKKTYHRRRRYNHLFLLAKKPCAKLPG